MTGDFMTFSTVLWSYQDDSRKIMKDLCNGNLFMVKWISFSSRNPRNTARLLMELSGLLPL